MLRISPDFQAKIEDLIAAWGRAVDHWAQRSFPDVLEKPECIKR